MCVRERERERGRENSGGILVNLDVQALSILPAVNMSNQIPVICIETLIPITISILINCGIK